MTLEFSNPSRHFDAARNCVCFWGYDSVIEISFYLEVIALQKICPDIDGEEAEFLKVFDDARNQIQEVAKKVYGQSQRSTYAYFLTAKDF